VNFTSSSVSVCDSGLSSLVLALAFQTPTLIGCMLLKNSLHPAATPEVASQLQRVKKPDQ
jgi:hypothetical protein